MFHDERYRQYNMSEGSNLNLILMRGDSESASKKLSDQIDLNFDQNI